MSEEAEQPAVDLAALTDQDLVDHLVVAVEEEDVLFCCYWLRLLKERDVRDAVRLKHSWKGHSALNAAATFAYTTLRLCCLQLLLSCALVPLKTLPTPEWQPWATNQLAHWGLHNPTLAISLLEARDMDQVALLVDGALPPPPNVENLTGYQPLPPRPSPLFPQQNRAQTSAAPRKSRSPSSTAPVAGAPSPLLPDLPPKNSLPPDVSSTSPPPPPSNPPPPPPPIDGRLVFPRDHPHYLHIEGLPLVCTLDSAESFLASHGVEALRMSLARHKSSSDAYFAVTNRSAADLAISRLHGQPSPDGSHQLFVERQRPRISPETLHRLPVITVRGLDARTTTGDFVDLVRSTLVGSAKIEVRPQVQRGEVVAREGSFRVSSPISAERAVRLLDGLEREGGARVTASWEFEGGGQAWVEGEAAQ
ncbi:hypothetical protein JCM10213_006039 [Rhodosporidiobolus nylandii]